jgi:hypothetical protein
MQLEGQQDGREVDARTARDRCLEAIVGAGDFGTQRSLWRAALKFHERVRAAGIDGDYADPRLTCAGTPVGQRTC